MSMLMAYQKQVFGHQFILYKYYFLHYYALIPYTCLKLFGKNVGCNLKIYDPIVINPAPRHCVATDGGALTPTKMKSKVAASFCLYLADTCWRNTRSTMPARSMISFFNCRHCQISCSFQAKGFESSSRAAHSFGDNDVFSNLGPASECPTKKIKLATEKPDDFVLLRNLIILRKPIPVGRNPLAVPLSSDNRISVNEILPSSTDDAGKVSDIEGPLSVSIKNVPSAVGLTELVEAISIFGKVSHASFVTASNKLRCCNIEFEDVESSRKASVTGEVTVGNRVFTIDRLDAVDLATIRIRNISDKTTDYESMIYTRYASLLVN
ncbi:hypothetical protein ACS0TY_033242 [Phlomoides rotata]